ncbi:MAG: hypothetical protein LBO74_13915 [Candidatus Symbiothrix sp.]|jgi:DNA-damage-inducible protein D|nr:hypothetical protein [Candidatus Symbiothrix sp.]
MSELKVQEYQGFEQIKQVDDNGTEFWSARELAPVLEYFADVSKTVQIPSIAGFKKIPDYKLSRYACYLIVQNDDKSRRDSTLLTVGFSLRTRRLSFHQVPQGRHILKCRPCRAKTPRSFVHRRLKPTVNKVSSLRDIIIPLIFCISGILMTACSEINTTNPEIKLMRISTKVQDVFVIQ